MKNIPPPALTGLMLSLAHKPSVWYHHIYVERYRTLQAIISETWYDILDIEEKVKSFLSPFWSSSLEFNTKFSPETLFQRNLISCNSLGLSYLKINFKVSHLSASNTLASSLIFWTWKIYNNLQLPEVGCS